MQIAEEDDRTLMVEWRCEGCNVTSSTAVPAAMRKEDLLTLARSIEDEHRRQSPQCQCTMQESPQLELEAKHVVLTRILEGG